MPNGAESQHSEQPWPGAPNTAGHLQARFMDAVVKVYCVHTEPNYSLPWQRKRQYASTSSGFIVASGKDQPYLLTNAHSVEYHSQVGLLGNSCVQIP